MIRIVRTLVATIAVLAALLAGASAASAAAIAFPQNGATVAGSLGVVVRTATGEDIVMTELMVNGVRTGASSSAPWGILWDTKSVPDGEHRIWLVTTASTGTKTKSPASTVRVRNGGGGGLAATYYRRSDLTDAALSRIDATLDFDWARNRPLPALPPDGFSVRWAGTVEAPTTDVYTFRLSADGGVRMWIADRMMVDEWDNHGLDHHEATLSLSAGRRYPIRIEFLDSGRDASIRLRWSAFHAGLTTIPQRLLRPTPRVASRTKGLRATFFGGRTFSGRKRLSTRVDPVMRFKWGYGSPDAEVPQDWFGARWSGRIRAPRTGVYQFWTRADDGVRVWVNGRRIINDWRSKPATTKRGKIRLRKGKTYRIRIDYYEAWGSAELAVWWKQPRGKRQLLPTRYLYPDRAPKEPPRPTTGLIGTYYEDPSMTTQAVQRLDNELDFDWDEGSPDPMMEPDTFSARWNGKLVPQMSGEHSLDVRSDDGVRLWLDGQLVIDRWREQSVRTNSHKMHLEAGRAYAIELQYFERYGDAELRLSWRQPGKTREVIPTARLVPVHPSGPPLKQQPPTPPAVPQPGLWGVYWGEEDFSGEVAGRVDANLDFRWGTGRAHPEISSDTFSAVWTGTIAVPVSDDYTFVTEADDGVRLWVDGRLLIDRWQWRSPPVDASAPVRLSAGRRYDIRVEHHEGSGAASMQLRWRSASMIEQAIPAWAFMTPGATTALPQPPPYPQEFGQPPTAQQSGLWGMYWDDSEFERPEFARIDSQVAFDWGSGRPRWGMGSERFTVRWLGQVAAPTSGGWRFHVAADDGVRLWVCGRLVIDAWRVQPRTEYVSQEVALTAGAPCDVRLDYFEDRGSASVELAWSGPDTPRQTVPSTALLTPPPDRPVEPWW